MFSRSRYLCGYELRRWHCRESQAGTARRVTPFYTAIDETSVLSLSFADDLTVLQIDRPSW
jgi:hypothetical protein